MVNFKQITLLLFVLAAFSCKTKKHSQTSWNNEKPVTEKEQYPEAEIGPYQKGGAPVTIKSVSLDRNFLTLEVSYSGGCVDNHDFRLIGSPILTKSLPPIRNVQLFHDAKGDNCKAIKTQKLKFSIVRLAESTEPGNKIKLQIENYKEMIDYSYE